MSKKKNRGQRLRPCIRCQAQVRFEPWVEEIAKRRKNIWHWVNEDGSHHYCRTQAAEINDAAENHIRAIAQGG